MFKEQELFHEQYVSTPDAVPRIKHYARLERVRRPSTHVFRLY